jgi:D-alanyl-D-alanine carboxypeptidase
MVSAQPTQGGGWLPPNPATLSARLAQDVEQAMAENDIPGALVAVTTPNGAWVSPFGSAELAAGRPMALSDSSAWRSITKSVTVTVVLQLVAEGRLELDAPVGRYLDGVPNGDIITLRQLAAMRSGLFDYSLDETFRTRFAEDLEAPWTDQELLACAFSHPVNFAAGTQYEYSNTNTVLLGVLAETVTGQSLDRLIEQRVLQPLGLRGTAYVDGPVLPAPFAAGYVFDEGTFLEVAVNGTALSGSGAMAGTLADLSSWGSVLVRGDLLPASLQQERFQSGPTTNGPDYDTYGLGMGEIRGWWGHTGAGIGYQACVFTEPVSGSQIAIMLNGISDNPDVPADLAGTIMDRLGWPRARTSGR